MYRIGQFASIFNVSIKTIRIYEEKKLLKPSYIDIYSGYRYYDEYLIVEWKSGDYAYGGIISCYYVFKKID